MTGIFRILRMKDRDLPHKAITEIIIGTAYEVMNDIGSGFLESVYENALLFSLREKGLEAKRQYPVKVMYKGQCLGDFYADLFIEDKVIVELKAVKTLLPEHSARVINYLKATGIAVALLINFGNAKLELKRFDLQDARKLEIGSIRP